MDNTGRSDDSALQEPAGHQWGTLEISVQLKRYRDRLHKDIRFCICFTRVADNM